LHVYLLFFVSATVTPVGARLKKPGDEATLVCNGTGPTEIVSAWYRNSSDGKSLRLPQTDDSKKYRASADNSLTVLKVGEWFPPTV